jgi:queuine tRNA-ribosyltransferase
VFSLSHLTRVDEEGAHLRSVVDGAPVHLVPEGVMDIQRALGADVIMAFDHCPADPLDRAGVEAATQRTHRWLERCVRRFRESAPRHGPQALFGIAQGGAFEDLRRASAEELCRHDLVGHAIGGVSVGEHEAAIDLAVRAATPHLPPEKPRYLMGVGTPRDFARAISAGVDLFDCVTPTRHGRNHQAYVPGGRINLRNQRFADDPGPLEEGCDCPTCARFSRAYLRHLAVSGEMLAGTLLTMHNLRFFQRMMDEARAAIGAGTFPEVAARWAGSRAV